MNSSENPLVPQGSFLDQKNRGRARVKIAVFVVLAIHGAGLLALLMQGCKPGAKTGDETALGTNAAPEFLETNQPAIPDAGFSADTTLGSTSGFNGTPLSNTYTTAEPPITTPPPTITDSPPPSTLNPPAQTTEYKIAKGDTYSSIGKKFNVSTRALQEANPNVDPNRLKIDQTIQIPPPSPASTLKVASVDSAQNGKTYKVQSGDTLSRIASKFNTTVKALRRENNLKTERILVGQTLKIPAKSAGTTNGVSAPGQ